VPDARGEGGAYEAADLKREADAHGSVGAQLVGEDGYDWNRGSDLVCTRDGAAVVHVDVQGAMSIAIEKLKPPMKA
jgi:hypothetical protein